MRTIYKYPLRTTERQMVTMPQDAKILTVQVQGDQVCLWALVDPSESPTERCIRVHGTGHGVPGAKVLEYIGTVQLEGGALVFHVFEEPLW